MKNKFTLIIAFIGMITLQSCVKEEINDTDTISEVFEYTNVNFYSSSDYSVVLDFPYAIYTSDMVLVYRLDNTGSSGDVWKPMPETYYFDDGTLDFGYNNDFTRYDAQVNLFGFDLPVLSNAFKLNQVFRVVVIPGYLNAKSANNVDLKNYNAVVKYYNIDEKNISKIKM